MGLFIIGLISVVLMFGVVIIFGAPYLPTLKKRTEDALTLLDLKPGQVLLELGSGDGRVLKAAAKLGIRSIGYEINPLLVIVSRLACWRYRKLITIKWRNYWQVKLPSCDAVFVFLLDRFMQKLDKKLSRELERPFKLVSFAFQIPGLRPEAEKNGLFLYNYPKTK
jgi:hypothetical protein